MLYLHNLKFLISSLEYEQRLCEFLSSSSVKGLLLEQKSLSTSILNYDLHCFCHIYPFDNSRRDIGVDMY